MELTLKLTTEQVQRMLVYLGEVPYKNVADIIDEIKAQATEQLGGNT